MSKKDKNVKKQNIEKSEKRDYKNPVESIWGKIIIWFLIFGMFGLVVIGSIWAIVDKFI